MPREGTADLELSRPGLFEVPQQCQMFLDHAKYRFRSVDRLKIFPDLQVIVSYRAEHFVALNWAETNSSPRCPVRACSLVSSSLLNGLR